MSIIVPTRDGRLLDRCVDSLLDSTTYPDFEVVVVDNSSRSLPTLEYLHARDDRLTVIRDERPFNYAAINNYAVERTSGDVVCLLNDDTEVISGEWLTEMVSQLLQPGIGAVGAKLYYGDWRIQHAGVVLGVGGVAGHAYRMAGRFSSGYFGNLQLAHRMSAVTAACIVVRREAWDQLAGLDETNLPVAFNDVDFCLRLREAAWEIVWTPCAQLLHHESISRGPDNQGPRAGTRSPARSRTWNCVGASRVSERTPTTTRTCLSTPKTSPWHGPRECRTTHLHSADRPGQAPGNTILGDAQTPSARRNSRQRRPDRDSTHSRAMRAGGARSKTRHLCDDTGPRRYASPSRLPRRHECRTRAQERHRRRRGLGHRGGGWS